MRYRLGGHASYTDRTFEPGHECEEVDTDTALAFARNCAVSTMPEEVRAGSMKVVRFAGEEKLRIEHISNLEPIDAETAAANDKATPCLRNFHYDREGRCLGCGEHHKTKWHRSVLNNGRGVGVYVKSEADGTEVTIGLVVRGGSLGELVLSPFEARSLAESILKAAQEKPWVPFCDDKRLVG